MVECGVGLALVNPLTALACAGAGLAVRRFSVSVPYRVSVLRPQHRPTQPLADLLTALIRQQAQALGKRLQGV
jgi:hypothetical protein